MDKVERAATVIMENEAKVYRAKCLLAARNVPGGYAARLAWVWRLSERQVRRMAHLGQMMIEEANSVPL